MTDYSRFLDAVADDIKADPHDGVKFHFLTECQKRGIIPEVPSNWFDEGRGQPFPSNWTASELSIFDNGHIPRPKKTAKTIRTTKTRFGGEWKAWTSAKVDFSKKAPWSHLISFFSQQEVLNVVEQQIEAKYLDEQTKALLSDVLESPSLDSSAFIGLARRQSPQVGTIWLKRHLVIMTIRDEMPSNALLLGDNADFPCEFGDDDASGNSLKGNAIAQARMATNAAFDRWHNQPKLY